MKSLQLKTIHALERIEKLFAKTPPTLEGLLGLVNEYSCAFAAYHKASDEGEAVRRLDEWHPKAVAWESKLYKAEWALELARGKLLIAARYLPTGSRR
jgi:hypothetical protein